MPDCENVDWEGRGQIGGSTTEVRCACNSKDWQQKMNYAINSGKGAWRRRRWVSDEAVGCRTKWEGAKQTNSRFSGSSSSPVRPSLSGFSSLVARALRRHVQTRNVRRLWFVGFPIDSIDPSQQPIAPLKSETVADASTGAVRWMRRRAKRTRG